MEMKDINGVEIAYPGSFGKGKDINDAILDDMITNFDSGASSPYLNLDHNDTFTDKIKDSLSVMRLGTVAKLYKKGKSLYADFKDVPAKIADLINNGLLSQRSIEFFRKLKRNGKDLQNVLHAVSFFGKDLPAIPNLKDLVPTLYDVDDTEKKELIYIQLKQNQKDVGNRQEDKLEKTIDQKEYDKLVKAQSELEKFKSDKTNESIVKLTDENTSLKKENIEFSTKVKKLETVQKEFIKFKADAAKEKTAALQTEAEKYVDEQINLKKVMPASKEMYVKSYIGYQENADELKMFKKDIESRPAILPKNLEDNGNDGVGADKDIFSDQDALMEVINKKMKQEKITFTEARKAVLGEE